MYMSMFFFLRCVRTLHSEHSISYWLAIADSFQFVDLITNHTCSFVYQLVPFHTFQSLAFFHVRTQQQRVEK